MSQWVVRGVGRGGGIARDAGYVKASVGMCAMPRFCGDTGPTRANMQRDCQAQPMPGPPNLLHVTCCRLEVAASEHA